MSTADECIDILESLKLQGISGMLRQKKMPQNISHLAYLKLLLDQELIYRRERRVKRNLAGAHFPVLKNIGDFETSCLTGITDADICNLLEFTWIDNRENLLFFGPPGVGKTHLSIAFGLEAIQKGYKVCFERVTTLIKLLKTMDIKRTSTFRINRIMKSDVLIIDEIGYTPIDRKEANLFFTLISELYERSSIILSSNKGFEDWAEMLGDEVLTTALLDRLLHNAHVISLDGDSFRNRKER